MNTIQWTNERLARLSISCCPHLGPRSLARIEELCPSWERAWSASRKTLLNCGVEPQRIDAFLAWRTTFDLKNVLQQLQNDAIGVLFPGDAGYPALLSCANDAPRILFVRGQLANTPSIAVVGSRTMSAYGKRCVHDLVAPLASAGICILSGMAFGIDGEAHRVALAEGGRTWAVLGTGNDEASLYPKAHVSLAHEILEKGGAIVTEFPPGTGSRKEHFPLRNRIIAGLASAVLVVEAKEKSGSLITAKCALEENREVLAVPGPIWNEGSRGTNLLIQAGARVCLSAQDLFDALSMERPKAMQQAHATLPNDPMDERILSVLDEPRHVDEVAELVHVSPGFLASRLTLLELSGMVSSLGGQMWARAGLRRNGCRNHRSRVT